MIDILVETGLFIPLAALLGVIVGVAASSHVDAYLLKSTYKKGFDKGKRSK